MTLAELRRILPNEAAQGMSDDEIDKIVKKGNADSGKENENTENEENSKFGIKPGISADNVEANSSDDIEESVNEDAKEDANEDANENEDGYECSIHVYS